MLRRQIASGFAAFHQVTELRMDRRSWPWKKKSSEKVVNATDSSTSTLSKSGVKQADQDNATSVNYKQISLESYKHLTELEDKVKDLHENLAAAQAEMATKDNLVKQHAKVAEEAVSGWEKAEAEASALKQQLEYVTLSKLTAEERASHLDSALKECMKQIRNVKEDSEQKLHDVVFAKTKQWEKIKLELEAKIVEFEQELLQASAENAALSRSLQERASILMKISDEKAQADAEIEVLKGNIQSCEREISSLKYEVHVVSKELEIRNEEKNMSIRSADVANKQHLEDVKKISKLEAECQRLRGLVRKKLPGPAALAQMKLEVENLGCDYGETRLRCSPSKSPSLRHLSTPVPDFAIENTQQLQKENEFLTARLLAMEEDMKMLKEALSKRNSELQGSRNMYAKTANKLHIIEAQMLTLNQHKGPPKPNMNVNFDAVLSQHESNPPSLTSMSEDGIDEEGSCSDSWATPLVPDLSPPKKEKDVENCNKPDNSNHLELMDDFLEMEKLACLSTDSTGTIIISENVIDKMKTENAVAASLADVQNNKATKEQQLAVGEPRNLLYSGRKQLDEAYAMGSNTNSSFVKLQKRIACIFESQDQDIDMGKTLADLRLVLQEIHEEMPQQSISCIIEETHSAGSFCDKKHCHEEMDESTDSGISSKQNNSLWTDSLHGLDPEFKNAISQIHDFIVTLRKETVDVRDSPFSDNGLSQKMDQFSSFVNEVLQNRRSINDFVLILSKTLSEASEMRLNNFNNTGNVGEGSISDCVDKVTLLENKVAQHQPGKENLIGASTSSYSSSHPEAEGPVCEKFETRITMQKFSLEEFEQLKLEKGNMQMELTTYTELLEQTKNRLVETEQKLMEIKSQLAASQKSNSLAETQLKCMAESYKLLESRTEELEAEVNQLHMKTQTLNNELDEERRNHQNDLALYKELREQIERNEKSSMYSGVDSDIQTKQESEIAAAAEKLAECQSTILLLSRQLQAFCPPEEPLDCFRNNRYLMNDDLLEDEPGPSSFNTLGMYALNNSGKSETESAAAFTTSRIGGNSPFSPSRTEAISPSPVSPISSKHRTSKPSMPLANASPDKHGRGFSRFFSNGKVDQ